LRFPSAVAEKPQLNLVGEKPGSFAGARFQSSSAGDRYNLIERRSSLNVDRRTTGCRSNRCGSATDDQLSALFFT
jgi:hypothetical protein